MRKRLREILEKIEFWMVALFMIVLIGVIILA